MKDFLIRLRFFSLDFRVRWGKCMFSFPGILVSGFSQVFGTALKPPEVRSNSPIQAFQCLGQIIFWKYVV